MEEGTVLMGKVRDTLLAKLAAASVPLSPALKSQIDRRFGELAAFFRVPDHPPYASMICEAIEKLGEESGSTEEAISEFIINGYKDLPLAHKLMLAHHLCKLSQGGEIALSSETRRYMLPGTAQKKQNNVNVRKRKGRKRRRYENQQLVVAEQGKGECECECGGIEQNEKEHKPKKRRGRRRRGTVQVLEVSADANVEEVGEIQMMEVADHGKEPLTLIEERIDAQQGVELMTESPNGEEFPIEAMEEGSRGVEVMTETQRPNAESSEEDIFSNEASTGNQADAQLSEVMEEPYVAEKQPCEVTKKDHESQDLHVVVTGKQLQNQDVQTKATDQHNSSNEGTHQEQQTEESEIMQVSPDEVGGDKDGKMGTWCQDASCAIERENLKREVAKRLRSQCHSSLFTVEVKQLKEEMSKMKGDMQEVAASEKQVHVDEELLTLKKTYIELLEKTKKVEKRLMEISISGMEVDASRNEKKKHLDEAKSHTK